ncbi:unnamed protein product [Gordionus sp. m RMFG-2023]
MITKSDDSDINIKKEDQEKINQFAITHAKDTELNVELNQIKKDLDSLKDASEEILITEENDIPYPFFIILIEKKTYNYIKYNS